jgi:8-amino-7-oxononanoate synthase
MYQKELEILKKRGRYRQRRMLPSDGIDLASNDYLGLGEIEEIGERAFAQLQNYRKKGAGASLVVTGYHPAHKKLEKRFAQLNRFEDGIVVGSGFLGNLALFNLPRRRDLVLIDKEYHASGIVGAQLTQGEVHFFPHNSPSGYRKLLETLPLHRYNRIFTFVEGIYSMEGDIVKEEICQIAQEIGYLVIDEAHSVGIVGESLLGVTQLYNLDPNRTIKMGTLGKTLGSYGGYILAKREITEYLVNRAKPIIYTTGLSPFDALYGLEAMEYLQTHLSHFKGEIARRKTLFQTSSLIKMVSAPSISDLLAKGEQLEKMGIFVGMIRPPTLPVPHFRVILRTPVPMETIKKVVEFLKDSTGKV